MRLAMLSVHTCPLAVLGGKDTGGMNVYVRELARELGRIGVHVDVFTRSQNAAIPRVVPMGTRVQVVHVPAGPEMPLARERIHDHLDEFSEGVDGWRIARGLEYDVVYAHYWLSGEVGLRLRARWSAPLLQMFHTLGRLKNVAALSAPSASAEREPAVRVEAEARLVGAVDRIVVASEVERRHLTAYYGAESSRIAVVPCGVDTDLFRPGDRRAARAALGLPAGPVVLYVGRLAPIKGLDTLIDALVAVRSAGRALTVLVIGGDSDDTLDPHEAHLRRRIFAERLGDRVRFLGPQPQEALRSYYVSADVTVLPSYYESFGMVALEAMACGSPVIGSRVGGLATTIRDGVTGFLVPEGDALALAERIDALVGDADVRRRLGDEGVRWAARHRWPCVAEAICREFAALDPLAAEYVGSGRCQE